MTNSHIYIKILGYIFLSIAMLFSIHIFNLMLSDNYAMAEPFRDVQTITKHVDEVMTQRFYRVKDLIKVPYELRSIYYFGTLTRIERIRLLNFLEK